MKKLFLSLVFFSLAFISFSKCKNCDCNSYREGKFYIFENGDKDTLFIVRNKNIHTEYFIQNGERKNIQLKVFWIKSCKFILRSFNQINNENKIIKGDVVVEILKTTETNYTVMAYLVKPKPKKKTFTIYRYNENINF